MDRSQERPASSKPFVMGEKDLLGASNTERLNNDADYTEIAEAHRICTYQAFGYASTMVNRIEAERPEAIEEKGMSKNELITYLAGNMCQDISKMHSKALREHVIREKDKTYLQDEIRRLYNGGHKYHPYL
eukprot:CAMPEP_0176373314 /NCGR_PEP_ID=MMETSP0126-20121128/25951_1 /TAXON_ID=141414 ORGANISM="Strombidinopsis acuminatum, Strain SPMC142" /NCGR_SAMPLE_ID=MMETSP0126 /ASSEMBLY_ACC=CAM_ASM_000229 /LENGTH=130 /DNA_ID=CAMNT_0017733401 /DNA_START=19 /DNA_END=411 /DNA_ORIENTATION=+